jgi:hypothetical protein
MIQFPDGFEFQGLYVFPALDEPLTAFSSGSEKGTFNYLPAGPRPETDMRGHPTLTVIPFGDGGFLQLGTRLGAADEVLKALSEALASRQAVGAEPVKIKMAPVKKIAAIMQIGEGTGNWVDAARSDTSGFPPYAAVFHLQTNREQQAAVMAAMNGRNGFLRVIYAAVIPVPAKVGVRIRGDPRDLLAERPDALEAADRTARLRLLVEEALAQGKFTVDVESTDNAPKDLIQKAMERAKARLIEIVSHGRAENQPDQAAVEASAVLEDSIEQPLELATDVADWFAGKAAAHVMLPPA